jgi:cytidyltransferase-like protein
MVRIYIDMCGDLFHFGHVNALKTAASYGDYLVVGVHSDETIGSYKKQPIMSMAERVAVIESCKYVDEVIKDAPLKITEEFLIKHTIDKVCIVDNRQKEETESMYLVPIKLDKTIVFPYTKEISTSLIINRIRGILDKNNNCYICRICRKEINDIYGCFVLCNGCGNAVRVHGECSHRAWKVSECWCSKSI